MRKEYQITVPIIYDHLIRYDAEAIHKELLRIGASRVFLAIGCYDTDPILRKNKLQTLKRAIDIVRSWNMTVGVWLWAFVIQQEHSFTTATDIHGTASGDYCCPADPAFKAFASDFIGDLAAQGPDIILLDDDFNCFHNGPGCACEHHMKRLGEALGRTVDPTELPTFFVGKDKTNFHVWRKVLGDVMLEFSAEIRKKIDAVDPSIRCGYCTSDTNWYLDGTTVETLTGTLAGNTEPILRLHAAPYWTSFYGSFFRPSVINESSRMQAAWATEFLSDVMSEGDVWPRPRYQTPANLLENFDTVLCMDGTCGGILKYSFDYTADITVETGYNDRHVKNLPVYRRITEEIAALPTVGVRVYEFFNKSEYTDLDDEYLDTGKLIEYERRPNAGILLADCNIPTTYQGENCPGIVFGANAWLLDEQAIESGLILDIPAAKILMERGVDVGLICAEQGFDPIEELFPSGARSKLWGTEGLYQIEISKSATVASRYVTGNDYQRFTGDEEAYFPAAYSYENANGQRFFVLALDGAKCHHTAYRFYDKSSQMYDAAAFVGRRPLAARCDGHPDLYMLTKQDDHTLAVGLWNNFVDDIPAPVVGLAEKWKTVDFVTGGGKLENDRVVLDAMAPYGFTIFILKK